MLRLTPMIGESRLNTSVNDRYGSEAVARPPPSPRGQPLDLGLLGDFQGVIDLDPQVAEGAFELGVA